MGSQSPDTGKVVTMRLRQIFVFLLLLIGTWARPSRDEVEGIGAEDEEFDENAAVNKVTELVSNWADNIGDVDMNLEINHEENEISHEKIKKKKCEKCVKKGFRVRNLDLCSRCEEEEQEEQEVTTAMTTPKQNDRKIE